MQTGRARILIKRGVIFLLYPSMSELLKKIDSRYLLVNVVAHRAREIADQADEAGDILDKKPVSLALDEISEGVYSAKLKNKF